MQELNQSLEETVRILKKPSNSHWDSDCLAYLYQEIAIDKYFKPIDRNVSVILSMQLESQEKNLKAIARLAAEEHAACLQIATQEIKKLESGCKDVAAITSARKQPDW